MHEQPSQPFWLKSFWLKMEIQHRPVCGPLALNQRLACLSNASTAFSLVRENSREFVCLMQPEELLKSLRVLDDDDTDSFASLITRDVCHNPARKDAFHPPCCAFVAHRGCLVDGVDSVPLLHFGHPRNRLLPDGARANANSPISIGLRHLHTQDVWVPSSPLRRGRDLPPLSRALPRPD